VPWISTAATVNNIINLFMSAKVLVLSIVATGVVYGISLILIGLAIDVLGISIAFSIYLAVAATIGAIIPMISLGEDYVLSWNGALVFASIALTIVGCSLLGFAGKKKDENLKKKRDGKILNSNPENNYTSYFVNEYSSLRGIYHAPQVATKTTKIPTYIGVLLAFVAGVLSSNQNLGLMLGRRMTGVSENDNLALYLESTSIYALLATGTFLVNFIWAVILLSKNRNWRRFFRTIGNRSLWYTYCMSGLMGVLSYAGLVLLGISNRILGSDGMVTAWMFYVCAVIFTSQLYGLVSKEWQGVDRRSIIMLLVGLVCAILSVVLAFVSCLV
jgi:L-rhamnose-H+ transport protein